MDSLDLQVLVQARDWREQGHAVWLVTVIETWGSAPRPPGALLAMREDGLVVGSVSGGCVEDDLIDLEPLLRRVSDLRSRAGDGRVVVGVTGSPGAGKSTLCDALVAALGDDDAELFRSLPLRERGFAIEPEIAARVLRAGERIHEVPISYRARSREAGKKLTALDGLRVLRTLVRCRLS